METLESTPQIEAARTHWRYRGQGRPDFAEPAGPGEESVWDFPRPPRIEPVALPLRVTGAQGADVAATVRGMRVCETAGAPTYYFPPEDVDESLLEREGEASMCEWKGIAVAFTVLGQRGASWRYERVFAEFAGIRNWYSFYPTVLACHVGDERVSPQPGGYYGGWVTRNLRGPIKGEPGSGHW